jgi:alpha-1,2-mannosyltransferase
MRIWKTAIIFFAAIAIGWAIFSVYRIVTTKAPDFSVLWLVARDYYKTPNPYQNPDIFTPNAYPPFSNLFYIPLTFFPFKVAQTIFVLLSFFSVLGSVFLSLKLVFKKFDLYVILLGVSLALFSFPTKFTLGMGQINAITLFLLIYSYFLHSKNKPVLSGILMGIAIMLKPIFGFFLIYFVLVKSWKVIFYSLLTVFSGFLGSLIYYGPGLWFYWIKDVMAPLMNLAGRESYYNQGLLGFISRLTPSIRVRKIIQLAGLLTVVPVIFYSVKKQNNLSILSVLVLTLLLADSTSWQHHFVYLIFPFTVLSGFALRLKKLWFWVLLGGSYLLVSWNFKNPAPFLSFPNSLLLSHTFYGAVILYFMNLFCLHKYRGLKLQREVLLQ